MSRNASHGVQLSRADKMALSLRIYRKTPADERGRMKHRLAELLSVSYDSINRWLNRIDKSSIDERNAAVMDLWMRCWTEQEIATAVGVAQKTLNEGVLAEICKCEIPLIPSLFTEDQPDEHVSESVKDAWEKQRTEKIIQYNQDNANHVTDFKVPIYNVWTQVAKSEGSEHFGNSEIRWVDNLLYLYTKPFDIVVDPFAGGGSTIKLCRKRFRRYWVSDRKPIVESSGEGESGGRERQARKSDRGESAHREES